MSEFPESRAAEALQELKSFQRRTVEYVFRRLYTDEDSTRRFLVADETGLGKTMVARGVIVKALQHLWQEVGRIDIIYICANQAIAEQNVRRLNVLGQRALAMPTRMTLLVFGLGRLVKNKVNIVSLTPGTTFNLRSSTGIVKERALLYCLLRELAEPETGLYNLLQVGVRRSNWREWVDYVGAELAEAEGHDVVSDLATSFRGKVKEDTGDPANERPSLFAEMDELCKAFEQYRAEYSRGLSRRRNALVARLRGLLAKLSVDMLEPDLIVLDEFQRFADMLHGDSDAAKLARELFEYQDPEGNHARTLLLSATPYRMLTLSRDREQEGDHYNEFLKTFTFLLGSQRAEETTQQLQAELKRFRRAMLSLPGLREEARELCVSIEMRLGRVISRTERVRSTKKRDSMVTEPPVSVTIQPDDLRQAIAVNAATASVGRHGGVEYWKSAPYLLNFMRNYVAKREMKKERHATNPKLVEAISVAKSTCLDRGQINEYTPLSPANGRMRAILDEMFSENLHLHLWIPPSLPYYGSREAKVGRPSKALVFSSWGMVPDAIAAILSYEAERRMGADKSGVEYFDTKHPRPLQFKATGDRPASLRGLLLTYPSPWIADLADPLRVVAEHDETLSYIEMRAALADRLRPGREKLRSSADTSELVSTWQWAGPAVLDSLTGNRAIQWLQSSGPRCASVSRDGTKSGKAAVTSEHYALHVSKLLEIASNERVTGPEPNGFLDLLIDLALGSPAICALRALRRVAPDLDSDDPELLTAASRIAWGFVSLYHQRDTVTLLRASDDKYWHSAITYGARENLQSVLDEFVHFLAEGKALTGDESHRRVRELANAIHDVLAVRPSQITVDEPKVQNGRVEFRHFKMRGRFAMRLADYSEEGGTVARLGSVRDAFNSPFRPFVLASTSIGQEGLDFHPYCRILYHWNLPYNPVDMEQREGRVHRYKCHAIRLNVAADHGDAVRGCGEPPVDPWAAMFEKATRESDSGSGLVPFWVYDGPAKVERRVPMLPFSREIDRLRWLKKSLAAYRLAFGQPRQDDLLEYLESLEGEFPTDDLEELQIRLQP